MINSTNPQLPQAKPGESNGYTHLGKIVGIWGVRGWVKLHSYTRDRIDIAGYKRWFLVAPRSSKQAKQYIEHEVLNCRAQGQGIVAQLANLSDRDQAHALNGYDIYVPLSDLPELPEDEYYWQQLIGLKVIDETQQAIGVIDSILETGANDVLVLNRIETNSKETGSKQVLVPYTPQVVLQVDLEQGLMTVDWDPDFLD